MVAIRIDLRRAALSGYVLVVLAALACGGGQRGGDRSAAACGDLRPGGDAQEAIEAARCLAATGGEGAAECREAVSWPLELAPEALGYAAECVLAAGDRADGVWLADIMASVGDDVERLAALAGVFDGAFDTAVHGVTFTTSLDDETQHALGRALPAVEPASRDALVALALAYSVEPLASYAMAFAGDVPPDDPAMVAFAERLDGTATTLGSFERRVLVETGTWSAQEAIDCYSGDDPRCEDMEGDSPLALLAVLDFYEVGLPSTPNAALRMLRSETIDPDSARGLATYIANADYPSRDSLVNAMMLDMTDASTRPEIRRAIAEAAAPVMCRFEAFSGVLLRARTSDPDRLENPDAVWPTFVTACAERHWSDETLMQALSAGSWLGVPHATWESLVASLGARTDDESCDAFRSLGRSGYEAAPWVLPRGTAHVVASRLGGEACAPVLTAPLEQVARSSAEHPEARLAAWIRLLELGDRGGCGQSAALLQWHDEDYDEGPGMWAEAYAAALNEACR